MLDKIVMIRNTLFVQLDMDGYFQRRERRDPQSRKNTLELFIRTFENREEWTSAILCVLRASALKITRLYQEDEPAHSMPHDYEDRIFII